MALESGFKHITGLPLLLLALCLILQVGKSGAEIEGGEWKRRGSHEYLASPWDTDKHDSANDRAGNRYIFNSARAYCQARGADLASIHDQGTMDWLLSNILPVFDGSCGYRYNFWVGLHKPTGDACTDDGCHRGDSSACSRCRSGWTWTDGSSYGSWELGWWKSHDPDSGDRYGVLNGCDSYRLYGVSSRYSTRALCMRDATVQSNFRNMTAVRGGDEFTFTCNTTSPSVTTFIWRLDGRQVSATDSTFSGGIRSELSYRGRIEDNRSNLTCTPVWSGQELSGISQSTMLQIKRAVNSDFTSWTVAPEDDVTVLTCSAFGFDPPVSEFTWYLNGVELSGAVNDSSGGETYSHLNYYGKVEDDGGNLTCTPVHDGQQLTQRSLSTTLHILRDHFTNPPSPIVKPYFVEDASTNCSKTPLDETCPVSMLKFRNETTFNVPISEHVFKYTDRIRLDEIRVFLAGLRDAPDEVQLVIGHYGQMMDRNKGEEYNFPAEPGQFLFSYKRTSGDLTKAACVSEKCGNNLVQLTPFTNWYVKVLEPEKIDLSSVTALEVYFIGTAVYRTGVIATPGTEATKQVDVLELEYGVHGLAELTRGCGRD